MRNGRSPSSLLLTLAAAVCLAGPVAAIAVPLTPPAWRGPLLLWAILAAVYAALAWFRRDTR